MFYAKINFNSCRDKISPDELMAMVNDTSLLTTVDLRVRCLMCYSDLANVLIDSEISDSLRTFYVLDQDVVNHEVFMSHLTSEEQELLMKDLPSLQGGKPPDRLNFVSTFFLSVIQC